jgi:hypothetical protein
MMRRIKAALLTAITGAALLIVPAVPAHASAPLGAPGCFASEGNGPQGIWYSSGSDVRDINQRWCIYGEGDENVQLHWIAGDLIAYIGNQGRGGAMIWASNLNGAGQTISFEAAGHVRIRDRWNNVIYTVTHSGGVGYGARFLFKLDRTTWRTGGWIQSYPNNPYNTHWYENQYRKIR